MRRLLAVFLLVASGSLAWAGELVELTDGTKLTVESHWNDGGQVHLIRGGVDMIVARSRIKSIDDDVEDPEVYAGGGAEEETAKTDDAMPSSPAPAVATEDTPVKADPALATMSASELKALQTSESDRLLEIQDARFKASHGGTPEQQKQAEEAFVRQNQRTVQIRHALEGANMADGVPTVPLVEQPQ